MLLHTFLNSVDTEEIDITCSSKTKDNEDTYTRESVDENSDLDYHDIKQNEIKHKSHIMKEKKLIKENIINNENIDTNNINWNPSQTERAKKLDYNVSKIDYKIAVRRLKLPVLKNFEINKSIDIDLPPGDMKSKMKVLNSHPFIFEIENFLDEEECGLLIDIAKTKSMSSIEQRPTLMELKNPEQTFKEWDYDQNGIITQDELLILPGLTDLDLSLEDIDDMLFVLRMDKNGDGNVDVNELKETNFAKIRKYFETLRMDESKKRRMKSKGAWVWHDEDGILKYNEDGYFEEFHERVSLVTRLPIEIIEESEPIQVRKYEKGQYQKLRQDSEPINKDVPCCLYGDRKKLCRFCRYISYTIFLNNVEEGGELVFPLANHSFQDITQNSGDWRGYYVYAKTTGHKFYFKVDLSFSKEGANTIFHGEGKDESGRFLFKNSIIMGETIKFEKIYVDSTAEPTNIKYHGKIIEGTKISGNWWITGQRRMRGTFFIWNKEYEIFSGRAMDQSNQKYLCANQSSLIIKPKIGKALFWFNHHINPRDGMVGDINQESMSAQCETSKGEKWIASSWLNIIGDGDLTFRGWRSGQNFLTSNSKRTHNLYNILGTNDTKLSHELYENEFIAEVLGANLSASNNLPHEGYYKHKPPSNALQAIQLLFNEMSMEQLRLIAKTVHTKLGMTCIPLSLEHKGKKSLVKGGGA